MHSNKTNNDRLRPLTLPALRALMGDRVYFVSTMKLGDVAQRVSYANEVHTNKKLNDLIQRRLNTKRADEIAEYLVGEDQRFFNALVIGVYGGSPEWQDFEEVVPEPHSGNVYVPPDAADTFGFLQLTGRETMFAVDGQHRLAGIRKAVKEDDDLSEERVATIFVAHESGKAGEERTRRLFTVLNKTAKPVLKGDIIALDEDDMMAICTRRLVDYHRFFNRGQVAMLLVNSLNPSDRTSWTTITTLYDILTILFRTVYPLTEGKRPLNRAEFANRLKIKRDTQNSIDEHYAFSVEYFRLLSEHIGPVGNVFKDKNPAKAVAAHRHSDGGHVLFRPVGQQIFTEVVAQLCRTMPLDAAIKVLAHLPMQLNEAPYDNVIWNSSRKSMDNSRSATGLCRDILSHMLGLEIKRSETDLRKRYGKFLGVSPDDVDIPKLEPLRL